MVVELPPGSVELPDSPVVIVDMSLGVEPPPLADGSDVLVSVSVPVEDISPAVALVGESPSPSGHPVATRPQSVHARYRESRAVVR